MLIFLLACGGPTDTELPLTPPLVARTCADPDDYRTSWELGEDGISDRLFVNSSFGPNGLELSVAVPVSTPVELDVVLQDGILLHHECGDGLRASIDLHPFSDLRPGIEATGEGVHLSIDASVRGTYHVRGTATILPTRVSGLCEGLVEGDPVDVPLTLEVTVTPTSTGVFWDAPTCDAWLTGLQPVTRVYDRNGVGLQHTWVGRDGVEICVADDGAIHLQGSGELDLVVDDVVQRTVTVREPADIDALEWTLRDAWGNAGTRNPVQALDVFPGGTVGIDHLFAGDVELCRASSLAAEITSSTPDVCRPGTWPAPEEPRDGAWCDGLITVDTVISDVPGICTLQLDVPGVYGGAGRTEVRSFEIVSTF